MRLLAILFCCFTLLGLQAHAQMRASCDADFFDVVKARATLEAQREIEMAQTILRKPDSVLEYSCFSADIQRLNDPAIAKFLFSNNDVLNGTPQTNRIFNNPALSYAPNDLYQNVIYSEFGSEPNVDGFNEGIQDKSFPPNSTDNEEEYPGINHFARNVSGDDKGDPNSVSSTVIFDGMGAYLNNNFNHTFLGGASDLDKQSTVCDFMARIWDAMKCSTFEMSQQNINATTASSAVEPNWFPTFEELTLNDPRQLPQSCNVPERNTLWEVGSDAAYPDIGSEGAGQTNEKVKYVEETLPTGAKRMKKVCCGASDYVDYMVYPPVGQQTGIDFCKVAPPVLTGLKITLDDGETYDEGFCARPGMVFLPRMERDSKGRDTRCRFYAPPLPFSYGGNTLPQCDE